MANVKRQPRTISTILNEVIERVNNDTQRLRILEQSSESILSRMNTLEQAALQSRRESQKNTEGLAIKLTDLEDRVARTEDTMKEVVDHMKKLVTESRLKEVEEEVDIFNPVKSNFVTKEELQKILAERGERPQKSKA
jgi:hypothetical protein